MTAPAIFHSGGDVVMSGFGRLDSSVCDYLLDMAEIEYRVALSAGRSDLLPVIAERGNALRDAIGAANRWLRASGGVR